MDIDRVTVCHYNNDKLLPLHAPGRVAKHENPVVEGGIPEVMPLCRSFINS